MRNGAYAAVSDWLGFATTAPASLDAQDALTTQLHRDQFISWVRHSYVMYPIGMLSAICLLADFTRELRDPWIRLCTSALVISYVLMITVSSNWLREQHLKVHEDLANIRFKLGLLRGLVGTSWGALLVALYAVANVEQRCLLYGVGIALMSTSIFGGSFLYGVTVWLPITAGLIISAAMIYPQTGPAPLVCLILYAGLTLYSIFYLSKKMRDFTLNGFELKSRNEIIKLVLNDFEQVASDWLWETDAEMVLVNLSPRLETLLGLEDSVPERAALDLRRLVLGDVPLTGEASDVETFVQRLIANQPFAKLILPIATASGQQWWMLSGKPRFNIKGDFIGYHGVGSDVTESHGFHQKVDYMARYDALTRTYNRSQFNECLAKMFDELTAGESEFCLISVDLDNFKGVNDTYGHATGDELLRIVAERIMGNIRSGDVVARIGGDEFCVLAYCADKDEGLEVANQIVAEINRPIIINDNRINTSASAGISYALWDGADAKTIMKQADLALYHAKKSGRGICFQYNDMIELEMQVRAKLEADLHTALHRRQFEMYFQPIFSLKSGQIVGVEALIRWRHPTRGLLGPGEFIETVERIGLIEPIGRWVVGEACRIGASIPAHIKISINLSPLQLRDQELACSVQRIIDITGIDPDRIEFEITESAVLDTAGPSMLTLQALRNLGVRFALDDFGTGHSSLSLLRRLNFDRVKIDRSFTAGICTDKVNMILIEKIIELSRALSMEVTVEGIETEQQADMLRKYDDIKVQGYLFGRPARLEDISFTRMAGVAETQIRKFDYHPVAALSNIISLERRRES